MLPTNAKMTEFVCSGRSREKVRYGMPKFNCHQASWLAMMTPTRRPTAPNKTDAKMKLRTIASSYSMRLVCIRKTPGWTAVMAKRGKRAKQAAR